MNKREAKVVIVRIRQALFALSATAIATAPLAAIAADAPKADLVNRQQLRVCSDPADLPFSNEKGEGFENKIAEIVADELKLPLEYTWYPKSMGFIRRTLAAKKCDLVIGWGQGDELVLNTNHFFRSVSALIYKPGAGLDGVDSLSDPRLKGKRIGVIGGAPPSDYVAKYGLMANAKPYRLVVDRRYESPGEEMVKDIRSGEIDAGVDWGPIAAYWARQGGEPLTIAPLLKDQGRVKLHYRITMGVRQGDDAWKRRINQVIAKRQGDIDKVLLDYGVPLLVDDDTSMEMITKPRQNGGEAPPETASPKDASAKQFVPVPAGAAAR
jgi:quinoprotein dehydrogenase-associated probable ABC transporter substrate-binding protein